MDRIDLHVHVPAVDVEKLTDCVGVSESSEAIRLRVQKARDIQQKRYANFGIVSNAELTTKKIKETCALSSEVVIFLKQAVSRLGLSARGYYRVIKISQTIADLIGDNKIGVIHVAEALQYRPKDEST